MDLKRHTAELAENRFASIGLRIGIDNNTPNLVKLALLNTTQMTAVSTEESPDIELHGGQNSTWMSDCASIITHTLLFPTTHRHSELRDQSPTI